MVHAQSRNYPNEWNAQTSLGFWDKNWSPNLCQTSSPYNNQENNKKAKKKKKKKKKKENLQSCGLCCPGIPKSKNKESEKKDTYQNFAWELIKLELDSDNYTNCHWCFLYIYQRLRKRIWGLRNKRTSGDHPNYSIIDVSQNTKKGPGDLRRLVISQVPVKYHQLTLM